MADNASEELLDRQVNHQRHMIRMARGIKNRDSQRVTATLNKLADSIRNRNLIKTDRREVVEARLAKMLQRLSTEIDKSQAMARTELRDLVEYEAEFQTRIFRECFGDEAIKKPIPANEAWRHYLRSPFVGGQTLNEWMKNIKQRTLERFRKEVMEGWANGESSSDIAGRI